jgi:hypothetical protein
LLDDKVLDGRNRLAECKLIGIEPKSRDVSPADPVDYVLSNNLHRRYLYVGRRAIIADKATEYYDGTANERK